MEECHLLLFPIWFLITLLWEIAKVGFCYNWDKEYLAFMGFKCGGLCNEQDKRDPRPCMHILLLSQDDELLNWEQSLPKSPSVVSFIDKTCLFSALFTSPHFSSLCHIEITQRLILQMEWIVSETCGLLFCLTALCSLAGLMIYGAIHLYSNWAACFDEPPVPASVCFQDISVH